MPIPYSEQEKERRKLAREKLNKFFIEIHTNIKEGVYYTEREENQDNRRRSGQVISGENI